VVLWCPYAFAVCPAAGFNSMICRYIFMVLYAFYIFMVCGSYFRYCQHLLSNSSVVQGIWAVLISGDWWILSCISCRCPGMSCVLAGALCILGGSERLIWLWDLCHKLCCQLCCGFVSNMGTKYFFDVTGYKVCVFCEMFVHSIAFCICHLRILNMYLEVMRE
jgi:hypothetical protein